MLYDCFLIRQSMRQIKKKYEGENISLFCEPALSKDGISIRDKKICLLCDDDIISILKNDFDDSNLISEV